MVKKMPKISVIVAVYNTEKYVDKCLESLINQTYKNIEIIIIEDGSTDNSKKILKKYEKNSKCIVSYNEKNSGLSYSRNKGMKLSTGDYLGFIDSDDYVDEHYFEKLMNSILDNDAEVAVCDMKLIFEKNNTFQISKCYNDKFNALEVVNNGLAASACNKLFKKSLITKYEFAVGKVNEDIAVVIPAIVDAKKIAYAEDCYYNYVQRLGSIQNSNFSMKRFDIFSGVDITLERIKNNKKYKEYKDALIFNQLIVLLIYVIPKESRFIYRNKILRKYNKMSKKYNIRLNPYFWKFLEMSGKKHRLYYKFLFKLECNGFYLFANLLISFYRIMSNLFKGKTVISKKLNFEDLEKSAINQSNMKDEDIKVSVIIPNYNYEKFMIERLYSILSQNYKLYEIIILDDCSKDNSREMIDKIEKIIKPYIKVKKIYNKTNSGSPFKQWKKGIANADGDYVWIAEADDYCESTMIKYLIKPIKRNKNIMISYVDTAFIDSVGNILLKSIRKEIDVQKSKHWNKSYVNNGIDEINKYSFLNNTIANVSSCLIKNENYDKILEEAGEYRQAGDWLFYVDIMEKGDIAYINKPINYYRMHGNNVSSTMNYQKHIGELNKIYSKYIKKYNLNNEQKLKINDRINFLKKAWKLK